MHAAVGAQAGNTRLRMLLRACAQLAAPPARELVAMGTHILGLPWPVTVQEKM